MLRTNLSTRPFYNERGVHIVLALLAAVVIAVTAWEVVQTVTLSSYNTELIAAIGRDRMEVDRLAGQAADIRRRMNRQQLQTVTDAAREANTLIEQRTFSWTAFFNQIEATLPEDVMLTSVRPEVKDETTHVTMDVVGKRMEAIDAFLAKLEAAGAFRQVTWRQSTATEDGLFQVTADGLYTSPAPAPRPTPSSPARPLTPSPARPPRAAIPNPARRGTE